MPHLIQTALAAQHRAARAAARIGVGHPRTRLLLAAAAVAATAAWDAGHRVADLYPPRRHTEKRAPRA
ncbi:hypothetical protein [Streptomyces werraensis]|uniref:Uncharacterized protein n=1 Tax=Streptomyces werraensis TaxID=68284 RepID=A0ABV3JP03_9ACTN